MRWKNCREILGIVDNNPELKPSDEFKNFYIKFSVIRLGIMVFLLLLAIAEIINISDRGMRLEINRDLQYILFFVSGFSLSIIYLLAAKRFIGSFLLFRLQLFADIFLTTWWVVLTGGSFSAFAFLYILCLFFYGRIIGFKTIIISSFLVWILLFIISCFQFYYPQYWAQTHIRGSDLAYNYSLLTLALILVSSLVKLSRTAENRLLFRLIEQEEALRKAEEIKYRVFDWIDAGLLVVNHDGRITTVNQRTLDWLPGHDRNEMVGTRFDAYFPEFLPFWKDRELACLRRNMVISTHRGLVFGFKMTELPENQGWMILFSDITEVQRLERQVKEMEKLASVGELAAGLAHEMKNPLAGIKTSLQLLLSDDLEKEFSDRLSRVILRDIDRLDFLLKDFLIFARPKAPEPSALDLATELDHVLMPLRLQYPGVTIRAQVRDEPFYFDRNQLHQILINLVVNALQALENTEDPNISILEERGQSTRTLVIADNGPGVAEEMVDKCFDPFVTSKAVGSGLGLAIARRLAAQNGTFIDLSNIPTGGTRAVLVQDLSFFRTQKDPQDTT
ncbi:signal transduction histidine kinase, nitrogen specific, NtrB [Desulfomicrobium baculatum DSM 4028]|uniref:histidine kinase n=1 Tax=Desulfomicrobium baculatum (strain DSM 4028 / VKM B-1378 / X) TaxID=525897 RepID=C7LWY5_DESBD|nr:signal transduction histidine kinase, nitrogen specific, NtrB [Desulfomicrobium baculatum DSM 4028]